MFWWIVWKSIEIFDYLGRWILTFTILKFHLIVIFYHYSLLVSSKSHIEISIFMELTLPHLFFLFRLGDNFSW